MRLDKKKREKVHTFLFNTEQKQLVAVQRPLPFSIQLSHMSPLLLLDLLVEPVAPSSETQQHSRRGSAIVADDLPLQFQFFHLP